MAFCKHKHTLRMANIDASTPQLKVVKEWLDAITSLDVSKVVPLISKDFKYQSLPHVTELLEIRDQARDAHLPWLKGLMALCTKAEVCIQLRKITFNLAV